MFVKKLPLPECPLTGQGISHPSILILSTTYWALFPYPHVQIEVQVIKAIYTLSGWNWQDKNKGMCDSETSSVYFFSLSILIISSPLWISPDDILSSALCYGCVVVCPSEMGGLHNNRACAAIIFISQGPKTLSSPCKVLRNWIFCFVL